jgi:hypothetical protein
MADPSFVRDWPSAAFGALIVKARVGDACLEWKNGSLEKRWD